MTLTFPTIAEQVLAEFNSSTKTVSIATLARKRGAHVNKTHSYWMANKWMIIYTFDDDTSLITRGRGKSYRVETQLP
jgi:hypothetical protein